MKYYSEDERYGMTSVTMPSEYYTDPAVFAQERERIFYRTWQYVCHANDIAEVGDYFTANIAGESIVVVRAQDGIHAFYNVCQHRAHQLTEGSGNCRLFRCPYHAWAYRLDGRLVAAPGTEESKNFDVTKVKLKPVRLDEMSGLLFVNLDPNARSMRETFPGIAEEIEAANPDIPEMEKLYAFSTKQESNWKVSVENFNECYHCAVVHKTLVSTLYSATEYKVEIGDGVVRHSSPRLTDRDIHGDLKIWFLWPNLAIELFPVYKTLSIRHFEIDGPKKTTYRYFWYAQKDLDEEQRREVIKGADIYRDTVSPEDEAIVASVQRGLESRGYGRGHIVITPEISPKSEHAISMFQSTYLKSMELPG